MTDYQFHGHAALLDVDASLQKHSLYARAVKLLHERFSGYCIDQVTKVCYKHLIFDFATSSRLLKYLQTPNPLSVIACICILAHNVKDILEIPQCLLRGHSYVMGYDVIETLYCIAVRLMLFRDLHGLGHAFTQ